MDAEYKPTCGLMQPTSGNVTAVAFSAMAKKAGRPPKPPDPQPGIYTVLSENVVALLEEWMLKHECSMTEAMKGMAEAARADPPLSRNSIQRAYYGRVDTGLSTLVKIAKAGKVRAADLLIEGECQRITDTRMSRSSSSKVAELPVDDARELHRHRRQ